MLVRASRVALVGIAAAEAFAPPAALLRPAPSLRGLHAFPFQGEQPNKGWVLGDKQPIPYPGEHKCLIPSELKTCYPLIISAMVPRPIALVSSMSASGVGNVAPFSYSGCVAHDPMTLIVSTCRKPGGGPKDTCANAVETKEFVVNIMSEWFVESANHTCGNFLDNEDEMAIAGLTPLPSKMVKPPRVGESAINFECKLVDTKDIINAAGQVTATLLFGEVVAVHVHSSVLDEEWEGKPRIDVEKLKPLGRLGGNTYTRVGGTFDLARPDRPVTGR